MAQIVEQVTVLEGSKGEEDRMSEHRAYDDMLAALINVRKLISEAAMTGFNCYDGDWAERLYQSQAVTTEAIKRATADSGR